ncbi:hypothetical protein [Cellvibrio sp. KY-GH-1]|uniref:hypothetical protein n=1 Tax=Cellvibrio sp. KY-GH-1 TaxID=2303332 RepID=UPI001CD98FFB|nr:hypothetical protein [Cellvibrio sp. KY-GH-1]
MELPKNTALIIIDQQQGIDHPKIGARNNPDAEIVSKRVSTGKCTKKQSRMKIQVCALTNFLLLNGNFRSAHIPAPHRRAPIIAPLT